MEPFSSIGITSSQAAAGFTGTLVSIAFGRPHSAWELFMIVSAAALCFTYVAPVAVEYLALKPGPAAQGVHVLCGLFGKPIVSSGFKIMDAIKDDPMAFIARFMPSSKEK